MTEYNNSNRTVKKIKVVKSQFKDKQRTVKGEIQDEFPGKRDRSTRYTETESGQHGQTTDSLRLYLNKQYSTVKRAVRGQFRGS